MIRIFATLLLACFASDTIQAQTAPAALWTELKARRERLPGIYQEFTVTRTFKSARGSQSMKSQAVLELSQDKWREKSITGSGTHLRIFDGTSIFYMEDGGDEYTRRKPSSEAVTPQAYRIADADWPKAKELERKPCNLPGTDHQCVILEVPLKPGIATPVSKLVDGVARVVLDLETGILVSSRVVALTETKGVQHQTDTVTALKRLRYEQSVDPNLFHLPSADMREVKELAAWNAQKIRKQLAGHPAPALSVTDLNGTSVTLESLKGKTVLLDFWTTWCPPCRADAPSLDKLYRKYGGKSLAIVSVSVSEDRDVVESFLKTHPRDFPVILTTENEMPRPYQIGVFPTYIVINPDGNIASAVEGDQGFGELRKLLKKAGLEAE